MFEQRFSSPSFTWYMGDKTSIIRTLPLQKVRSGTQVPDWKRRVKSCIDATSNYSIQENTLASARRGSYTATVTHFLFPIGSTPNFITGVDDASGGGFNLATGLSGVDPALLVPSAILNSARSRFVTKCLNQQRLFNGGTVLGELHKTYESLRHPLTALRSGTSAYLDLVKERAYRASKKKVGLSGSAGTAARRRSVAKAVQGTYLEYVYGITPTLYDMRDAVHAAAHIFNPDLPMRSHIRVSQDFNFNSEALASIDTSGVSVKSPNGNNAGNVFGRRTVFVSGKVTFTGSLRDICPGHDRVRLLGLGLRDFVPTLWELLPYSFLVDYFVNVGDIFDALSFQVSDLAWGCMAVKSSLYETISDYRHSLLGSDHTTCDVHVSIPSSITVKTTSYVRTRLEPLDLIPSVQLSLPFGKQLLNTTALVAQHSSVVNFLAKLL